MEVFRVFFWGCMKGEYEDVTLQSNLQPFELLVLYDMIEKRGNAFGD